MGSTISSLYEILKSGLSRKDTSSHMHVAPRVQLQHTPSAHKLPNELLIYIITIAAVAVDITPLEPLDISSTYPLTSPKAKFSLLAGLNGSCRMYHIAVQKAWYRVLYIREKGDWEIIAQLGVAEYVRELRVLSNALGRGVSQDVFMQFTRLHTAVIDAHNDFELNSQLDHTRHSERLGQYYNVAPRFPSSLRRLHVMNVHGPDIAVIQTLRSYCPHVQELSISRCTMFSPRLRQSNSKDVLCTFWTMFPNDHDSYFANEGIEDYAAALAHEMKPLENLRSLHMGLYLTPHAAISTHAKEHHQCGSSDHSLWDYHCQTCSEQFGAQTRTAEVRANEILFHELPMLQSVSWASFFTATRQDPICYDREPETRI